MQSKASTGGDGDPGVSDSCRRARVSTTAGAFSDAPGTGGLSPAEGQSQAKAGQGCILCGEPFPDVPVSVSVDGDQTGRIAGYHRECFLYGVIGHAVGVCGCTGYPREGQSVREAARLACRLWSEQHHHHEQQGPPG